MNNQQVYIHIGMPRTATTFFQQELFPHLSGIKYFGLDKTHYSEVFNKLQFSDDSFYIEDDIIQERKQWGDGKILLSNENFIGQSIHFNHVNRSLIANRLKQAFPDAKILLVLRNQVDLLASMYAINIQWNETRPIDKIIWLPFQEKIKSTGGPASSYYNTLEGYECLDGYDYLPLINLYKSLFSSVEVLLFEDFILQPEDFSTRLASFFEVEKENILDRIFDQPKMNSGVSEKQAKKLAKLNKFNILIENSNLGNMFLNRIRREILKSKKTNSRPFFSQEKEEQLILHFREKNRALNEKYPAIGLMRYAKDYYLQ